MWNSKSNEDLNMNNTNIRADRDLLMASLIAVPACQRWDADTDWFPAVDITEDGREYILEVDLPGLKPEQIQVSVNNGALCVSGDRLRAYPGGKSLRVERPSGAFVRRLPLPQDARSGEIHASLCDGVLELRMPRGHPHNEAEQTKPVALELEAVAV